MYWLTVGCRTFARFVELCWLVLLSASSRIGVSVSERSKIPVELQVPSHSKHGRGRNAI